MYLLVDRLVTNIKFYQKHDINYIFDYIKVMKENFYAIDYKTDRLIIKDSMDIEPPMGQD